MYYTIYKITNIINGKIYVGKHQTENLDDNYFGSGKNIKQAIKKYGKKNFKKEILFIFDNEFDMNQKEIEIITEEFVSREDTYNLGVGGEGGPHFKNRKHSNETKLKIKNNLPNKTDSARKNYSERMKTYNSKRSFAEETKKKISEKAKLRYSDKDFLEKFCNSARNRPPRKHSEETKRKISESIKNKKFCGESVGSPGVS